MAANSPKFRTWPRGLLRHLGVYYMHRTPAGVKTIFNVPVENDLWDWDHWRGHLSDAIEWLQGQGIKDRASLRSSDLLRKAGLREPGPDALLGD